MWRERAFQFNIWMFFPISAYSRRKVGSNVKNGQILKFKGDLKEFKQG